MSGNHAQASREDRAAESVRGGSMAMGGHAAVTATPAIPGAAPEPVLCGECARRLDDCDCDGTEAWPAGWWLCEACSAITDHLDADGERFCESCEEAYEDDNLLLVNTPEGREEYARMRASMAVHAAERWYENAETWQHERRRIAGDDARSPELVALSREARAAISELDARIELHAGGEAIREALRLVVERAGAVARSSDAVARTMRGGEHGNA